MTTGSKPQSEFWRFSIYLDENQSAILAQWRHQIDDDGRVGSSKTLSVTALLDHLPDILTDIAQMMREPGTNYELLHDLESDSEIHGKERWAQGYSLVELILEIEHFRKILLIDVLKDFALENTDINGEILVKLGSAMFDYSQKLIVKSVEEYAESRDAELRAANDRVTEASLQLDIVNKQLLQECHEFREISLKDPLTSLANRRQLDIQLLMEVDRCIRYGVSLCIVMMDVDHFKQFNDTYGHAVGDRVLVQIARHLEQHSRASDHVVRYGGEEFLLLLPQSDLSTAEILAERIRTTLSDIELDSVCEKITGSFGVAQWLEDETTEQLLNRADRALYDAKAAGRNRLATSTCKSR